MLENILYCYILGGCIPAILIVTILQSPYKHDYIYFILIIIIFLPFIFNHVCKINYFVFLYRIKTRTKKWTVKLIFQFVDFALVNAWLEYSRDAELCDPNSKYMDLLEFRSQVAEALIKTTPLRLPVGRPRKDDSVEDAPAAKRPINYFRCDRVDHLPIHVDTLGQRCKIEKCHGRSRIKCGVHLCLNKENNGFITYHQK